MRGKLKKAKVSKKAQPTVDVNIKKKAEDMCFLHLNPHDKRRFNDLVSDFC